MAPEDPEITELLTRAAHGNHSAVEQLLARHRDRLRRMVAVRMDDRLVARVDPSDVVQETLAMAAQRLAEYLRQPPLPFYPWLRQIASDRLADLCRRHIQVGKRTVRREEQLGLSNASALQLADRVVARGSGPLKHLVREELRARVRAALAKLATMDREILILRHLEQLSFAESATVLGITETAAKQRHVRALRRIRLLLDDAISEVPS